MWIDIRSPVSHFRDDRLCVHLQSAPEEPYDNGIRRFHTYSLRKEHRDGIAPLGHERHHLSTSGRTDLYPTFVQLLLTMI